MNQDFDYREVPHGFAHCFRGECPKSPNCLRHTAATHSSEGEPYLSIVNPAHLPTDTSNCSFYRKDEKIRVAWGVKRLFDNMTQRQACDIRQTLVAHFEKNEYYRVYRKEHYLTPQEQAYILRVFQRHGIQEEPAYEYYSEVYLW